MDFFHYLYRLLKIKGRENINFNGCIPPPRVLLTISIESFVNIGNFDSKANYRDGIEIGTRDRSKLTIGKGTFFNDNVHVISRNEIIIGKNVMVGPNVLIYDHDHDFYALDRKNTFRTAPIHIGDNVWIGGNAIILRGTIIGNNSVVGAGSVVKGRFPDNVVIAGNPAKVIKNLGRGTDCVCQTFNEK